MLKAWRNNQKKTQSNSPLKVLSSVAVSALIGIITFTSATAQDRNDPWEQPPHPAFQDNVKEPSTSSTYKKPENPHAQKIKKRTKTGQATSPTSTPAAAQSPKKSADHPVVTIVPGELDLTNSDWGKTLIVEIKNTRADMTAYSVWIKLRAQAPGMRIDDVEILSETGQEFISESFGGINANFEVMMFTALDVSKRPCKYLLIYRLKGSESRFFKIRRKPATDAKKKPLTLLLSVGAFSEKPSPIATKDGAVALQIAPPESMTIEAISVLMKKDLKEKE